MCREVGGRGIAKGRREKANFAPRLTSCSPFVLRRGLKRKLEARIRAALVSKAMSTRASRRHAESARGPTVQEETAMERNGRKKRERKCERERERERRRGREKEKKKKGERRRARERKREVNERIKRKENIGSKEGERRDYKIIEYERTVIKVLQIQSNTLITNAIITN